MPEEGDGIEISQQLRHVMTWGPVVLPRTASVLDAAEAMAEGDVSISAALERDRTGRSGQPG
ncbi:MAG TPA: hypothetical protein VHF27_08190 [Acidimicrobiales bacterium]|nr:hypothetical protein [Acidimicrobiales bacterium]